MNSEAALPAPADVSSAGSGSGSALSKLGPLEAVLFDIDGTLCDSDPIHFRAFRELLQQVGFNDGVPITDEFYSANISGGHNDDLARALFPDMDFEKAVKFMDDKEAFFRKYVLTTQAAGAHLAEAEAVKLVTETTNLNSCKQAGTGASDGRGRAARPAPVDRGAEPETRRGDERAAGQRRADARLLGLADFFPVLVIGSECARAKPFPDPYLQALELIGASPEHTVIFEDSASGVRAGVAAGVPVIGLTTRNPEKALKDAGASLLIKDFQDPKLLSLLEEIQPAVSKFRIRVNESLEPQANKIR